MLNVYSLLQRILMNFQNYRDFDTISRNTLHSFLSKTRFLLLSIHTKLVVAIRSSSLFQLVVCTLVKLNELFCSKFNGKLALHL